MKSTRVNVLLFCLFFLSFSLKGQWSKNSLSGNKDLYALHILGDTAYVAGLGGSCFKSVDAGKSWSPVSVTGNPNMKCMYFLSNDTGFVAGENARVLKTEDGGQSWTQKYVRTAAYAFDIQFRGNNGLLTGKNLLIASSSDRGNTWKVDTTFFSYRNLNSVCITPGGMCWAVGDSGIILYKKIDRHAWNVYPSPTNVDLNKIVNIGDDVLIACGGMPDTAQVGIYRNVLLRSTDSGKTWMQTDISEMKTINTAWFSSRDTGFMAGSNGIVSKVYQPFNKRGQQLTGTASTIHDLSFVMGVGLAVGDGGVVLRTENKGGFGLGIIDVEKMDLDIYPNPSKGKFRLSSKNVISILALDVQGKSHTLEFLGDDTYELKETGLFLLMITYDDQSTEYKRISIQR